MSKPYDYLIVGSGLFGATFAYRARQAGRKCLVIEKRSHLGGNVYCEPVSVPSADGQSESTINVHKYGAHIFHTSNKEVWDFVNGIVPFNRYTNCPVANYKGHLYNLPFNMNTFCQMWGVRTPREARATIDAQILEAVEEINRIHAEKGLSPLTPTPTGGWEGAANLEEQALCLVGRDIFRKLIKEYTEKQWGRDCKDLPAFIIRRLPVRLIFDNNYFNDTYQGIPIGGYNKLIEGLLAQTDCITDTDFFQSPYRDWKQYSDKLVYTGPLDQYFDYQLGRLDWRTVTFRTRMEDTPNYQGNAVVNYTSHDEPYTRVIEHKHFEMFGQEVYNCPRTVISEEYSCEYDPEGTKSPASPGGLVGTEPYYPVNDDRNNALADQYRQLALQQEGIIFGGRLAQYRYYDMAPVIEQVLKMEI